MSDCSISQSSASFFAGGSDLSLINAAYCQRTAISNMQLYPIFEDQKAEHLASFCIQYLSPYIGRKYCARHGLFLLICEHRLEHNFSLSYKSLRLSSIKYYMES